jgi:exportin-T
MFDVLDQLIGPLNTHITNTLSQPATGTDDERSHQETKKSYLALLNNVVSNKLLGIFTSESWPCFVLDIGTVPLTLVS